MSVSSIARALALVFLVSFVSLASGCAQERDPINRVQAGAFDKEFFVGPDLEKPDDDPEFYMRTTVVDVASGAGSEELFTSSDAQPLVRIRWEIQETELLARLTYELIQDTDYKGASTTPNGQVVAAYAIQSHFDIRRSYNATTGEELNEIEENTTDRPWYQRQYMRVDWSRNLITNAYDLDTLSQIGIYGAVAYDPIAYYIDDPSSPDAPVYDKDGGYLDVTNKAFAAPQVISDPIDGDFPACFLLDEFPWGNCNPSEITLRQSFKRVVDTDYEPLEYDGNMMQDFGFFTSDRYGYDRRYGIIDQKWHRFADRWNIWEKSHAMPIVACATTDTTPVGADPHRDLDADGTEDECASVGRGSRCDEFKGLCTIPMRDRKVKTIPWYVNADFPEELFAGTQTTLDGWSEAIRVGVVASRLAECRRTKDSDCETTMGWPARWADDFSPPLGSDTPDQVAKVFVLCHNPVDPTKDDPACGDPTKAPGGKIAPRLGDLRYNFINLVNAPQLQEPWGIMVDGNDPLTGEDVAGSVNQWGAVLDRASATLVDLIDLINGQIDPSSYIQGQNVTAWVQGERGGEVHGFGTAMSLDEINSRKSAVNGQAIAKLSVGLAGSAKTKKAGPPAARRKARLQQLLDAGRLGTGNGDLAARLSLLHNTAMESKMVTPDMVQTAGQDPTAPPSKQTITRASPFTGRLNPTQRRATVRAKRLALSNRHACRIEEDEPDNLLGLAKSAASQFPPADPKDPAAVQTRRDAMYLWARQQYSNGVFAHELGHSMGLRHNFAATFDSLNYRPQYWQLRTSNGSVTTPCADGNSDGTNCVGPRWKDPETQAEIDGNINRYATTSVMDYPGDQNHDQLIQGKYDKAAMRFGYGGVVDLWADPSITVKGSGDGQRKAYELAAFDTDPGIFGIVDMPPVDSTQAYVHIHYSGYQKEFNLISNCRSDSTAELGTKCDEAAMDVADYRDMQAFAPDPSFANYSFGLYDHAVDAKGRVRRGYLFSSDEYADSGNVPSFTYDAGADPYEQIRFLEAQYENRYILDGFRRDRTMFNSDMAIERMQEHYLDTIQEIAKTFAFGAVLDGDPTQPSTGFLDDGNYGPMEMGATVALDLFARMLTRPEPGSFCDGTSDTCAGVQPDGLDLDLFIADPSPTTTSSYDFHVPLVTGRYVHNDFDYSKGYWWADYQTQVGAYYEKVWATYYLSEAFDDFISNSKEDFTDGRYKNVNFATVFPDQVRRLFGNMLTGDYDMYAPWTTSTAAPSGTPADASLIYPTWHDPAGLGTRVDTAVKLVDPNFAWQEQLYAMVWGAMYFPTNWSNSWIDDARITELASDQVTWPANETYSFYNPDTGITYHAHAAGTETLLGVVHQKGVGARMLEWGNHLVGIAFQCELDVGGNCKLNPDGTPILVLDGNGKPQLDPDFGSVDQTLQAYVSNIDTMRQLTALYSRDLTDDGLPQP